MLHSKIENLDFPFFWACWTNIDEIYLQSVIEGHLVQFWVDSSQLSIILENRFLSVTQKRDIFVTFWWPVGLRYAVYGIDI